MKNNKGRGFSCGRAHGNAENEVVKRVRTNVVPFARLESLRIKIRNAESFAASRAQTAGGRAERDSACISFPTKTQVKR